MLASVPDAISYLRPDSEMLQSTLDLLEPLSIAQSKSREYTPDRSLVHYMTHILTIYSHTHIYCQFRVSDRPKYACFGLWEETKKSVGNFLNRVLFLAIQCSTADLK